MDAIVGSTVRAAKKLSVFTRSELNAFKSTVQNMLIVHFWNQLLGKQRKFPAHKLAISFMDVYSNFFMFKTGRGREHRYRGGEKGRKRGISYLVSISSISCFLLGTWQTESTMLQAVCRAAREEGENMA